DRQPRHDPIDEGSNAIGGGEDDNGHPPNGKIVQPVAHTGVPDVVCTTQPTEAPYSHPGLTLVAAPRSKAAREVLVKRKQGPIAACPLRVGLCPLTEVRRLRGTAAFSHGTAVAGSRSDSGDENQTKEPIKMKSSTVGLAAAVALGLTAGV